MFLADMPGYGDGMINNILHGKDMGPGGFDDLMDDDDSDDNIPSLAPNDEDDDSDDEIAAGGNLGKMGAKEDTDK